MIYFLVQALAKSASLVLYGGECDPINFYWDHHHNKLAWWRCRECQTLWIGQPCATHLLNATQTHPTLPPEATA